MQNLQAYQPAPDLLAGRTILVTGAGSGIGAAAARAFAAHGATVVLLGRTIRKLEATYDAIEQSGGPQPAIYPMNLEGAAPKDYEELATTLGNELGRLDGLLHNAALLGSLTPLEHYDLAQWSQLMQVNLNAPYLLTRACLPLLKASDDASVVFTTSSVGRRGRAYWGAYAISKAACDNMAEIFADELEANTPIRVNTLNPGAVRTRMRNMAYPAEDPTSLPTADSLMAAWLWLIGPDSRGHTGQHFDAQ